MNIFDNEKEIFEYLEMIPKLNLYRFEDYKKLKNTKFMNSTKLLSYTGWNKKGFRIEGGMHGIRLYGIDNKEENYFDISTPKRSNSSSGIWWQHRNSTRGRTW